MKQVVDPQGRLQLPATFQPGDVVDVEVSDDKIIVSKLKIDPSKIHRVVLPNGLSVIRGLPPVSSEDVKRLLEDFP